jgi:hypothetical protein
MVFGVFATNGALAAGTLAVSDDNVNNPQALTDMREQLQSRICMLKHTWAETKVD